jgi:hypothetical protein
MLSFHYKEKEIGSVRRAIQTSRRFFPIYKLPAMKHLTNKHQLLGLNFSLSSSAQRSREGGGGCQNTRFHYKVSIVFKARDFRIMFLSLLVLALVGVDIRHPK